MASMGLTSEEQKAVEEFRTNVIEPSMTKLVVLDFWAEWCEPCKQLGPVIEKVCAEYADKGVLLIKVDVDKNRFISEQFQVQSIPTVFALFQGRPVANLTSARTESQLKEALDQILAQVPVEAGAADAEQAPDIAPLLQMGEDALAAGDATQAQAAFVQILQVVPDSLEAVSGLIRALCADGKVDDAKALVADLPEGVADKPELERALSAIALAESSQSTGESADLRAAMDADPDDHAKRYALAEALWAEGARDDAADQLLTIVKADKDWNDGAARAKLLQIFDAVGLEDPWVSATRRKLSAALFG